MSDTYGEPSDETFKPDWTVKPDGSVAEGWGDDEGEMATQAEEPVEDRIRKAWLNGFDEGTRRQWWGPQPLDHS